MPSSSLPKLSYVLLSHNREKYIRGAIESAFAQDYEGELEYIFSDDCSTDRTFEIIKECVAAYKGNRRVVVTQTPKNLHLAGNTNHAVQFVTSDWVIRADDDDYSAIDRCTQIGRAIARHPRARYVTTGKLHFTDDEDARIVQLSQRPCSTNPVLLETHISTHPWKETSFRPNGLSYKAWHINVYRQFEPLHLQGYYIDDLTCFYRASVLGTGVHLPDFVGVYMRDGSNNMSRGGDDNQRGYASIIRLEDFNNKYFNLTYAPLQEVQQSLIDYVSVHQLAGTENFMAGFERDMQERALQRTFWRKGTLNRIRVNRKLGHRGIFHTIRCLPLPVFALILSIIRKFK